MAAVATEQSKMLGRGGGATVIVAGHRPPLQYQRSVCQLLASGEPSVTLRGAGRAATMSMVLAAQMEAKRIVTIENVQTAVVPCADEAGSESGRLAVLSIRLNRHAGWKGSRYIPTFISFATEESLKECGSLVAFSNEPDAAMAFGIGMTSTALEAAASGGDGPLHKRGVCDKELERVIARQFSDAAKASGEVHFHYSCQAEAEKNGKPCIGLRGVFVRRAVMEGTAVETRKDLVEDRGGSEVSTTVASQVTVGDVAAMVGILMEPIAHRNNGAVVVVIVPVKKAKRDYLRDLRAVSQALVGVCCDANLHRGEKIAKVAALRIEPFGFDNAAAGCTPKEIAEAVVHGFDSGFHLHQAPRLQFLCGSMEGDAIKEAWMEYTGISAESLLFTTDKFRVKRHQSSKKAGISGGVDSPQRQQRHRSRKQQRPTTAQQQLEGGVSTAVEELSQR